MSDDVAMWPSEAVRSATWKTAKAVALEVWQRGSADTTQMLMCVNAALEAVVPALLAEQRPSPERIEELVRSYNPRFATQGDSDKTATLAREFAAALLGGEQ